MADGGSTKPIPTSLPLGRDSVTYRVLLEPMMIVGGGPRALLAQVSHPVVGAGVAQHSDYERDPWTRLIRTLLTMTQLSLGTSARSTEMRRLLRRSHATINGTREDGQPYRALDPENMLWVWATLLDAVIAVHDTFVRPLTRTEREQLYEEWLLIAEGCTVPRDVCPADYDAFVAYVDEVVRTELTSTQAARNVARMIQDPAVLPAPVRQIAASVLSVIVPGMVPAPVRDLVGITQTRTQAELFTALAAASRLVAKVTPGPLRRLPGAVATFGAAHLPLPPSRSAADRRERVAA